LETLLARLLAREADARPATPATVAALLERANRTDGTHATHATSEKPKRRPRKPWWPLLASAVLGILAGGAARLALEAPPPAASPAARSFATVDGIKGEFPTLKSALAAVRPGGVVVLHGEGPFLADGLWMEGTIRAAQGSAPRLEAGPNGWEPMLAGNLALMGLSLTGGEGPAPLVESRGTLLLVECALRGKREGPLVSLRRGSSLRLERCRIDAARQALSVEPPDSGPCAVELRSTAVHVRDQGGTALLAWRGERGPSARVRLSIHEGSLRAGRIAALRYASASVRAKGTRLAFSQALASIDGGDRSSLRWQEEETVREGVAVLRVDGRRESLESLASAP
ncbi:MAG: hypothetical protein K2W96_21555, partial [Gemmataceae bacterium]|nr:hypothetical protein [Gemmataceae bacterium]